MRAWLSRLHLGGGSKEKEKEKDREVLKEKFPPLKQWPPPPATDRETQQQPQTQQDFVTKKVAFKSPTTTPTPAAILDDLPDLPQKTTLTRFTAKEVPRASTSESSKTDLHKTSASPYPQSIRSATPYSQMSSNTTGSRILAASSWSQVTEGDLVSNLGSRERTRQEVLFEIISSEDRYVQELVKMKDTFIDPLLHPFSTTSPPLSNTPNLEYDFFRSESPAESTDHLPPIAARFMSPSPNPILDPSRNKSMPNIDGDSLDTDDEDEMEDQIGKPYPVPKKQSTSPSSQAAKHNHPRSPYRSSGLKPSKGPVPFPTRSHHSLPPPPRVNQATSSTHTLVEHRERNYSQGHTSSIAERKASHSSTPPPKQGMLRKFKKTETNILGDAVPPHQLPEDLRICLEVLDSGVFDGHKRLVEALKKRYDDQYPLVRSLADVFVANADIFQGYATYVLHLERALAQVDSYLSHYHPSSPKKPKVALTPQEQRVAAYMQKLEELAATRGETGLAISLSKPFQRLLKYPLLFQNLLFHTDPSTFEYEATLQLVAEVEGIVRSIEDEKVLKEERDRTWDVFARIEGLEKVRGLAVPKPSRVLLEERQMLPLGSTNGNANSPPKSASPPPAIHNKRPTNGKSSFKRLSDALNPSTQFTKKDMWFVVFNDVVLQCQRTGVTSVPLVSAGLSKNGRANSLPGLPESGSSSKSKFATTGGGSPSGSGRSKEQGKARNLYKFVKIETWAIGDVVQPREGVVSMEAVVRSHSQAQSNPFVPSNQPRIIPLPDDKEDNGDGSDSDDSDRKSKMSFSYWGADKVTVQKPVVVRPRGAVPRRGVAHGLAPGSSSYGRESSANAKFGTRLVSNDGSSPVNGRPASRRTQATTPVSRRGAVSTSAVADDLVKATVTRPEWNTSTRPLLGVQQKRVRNISQTSGTPSKASGAPNTKGLSSPAPSEDSGVGLYRQMLAKDPGLNGDA